MTRRIFGKKGNHVPLAGRDLICKTLNLSHRENAIAFVSVRASAMAVEMSVRAPPRRWCTIPTSVNHRGVRSDNVMTLMMATTPMRIHRPGWA